MERTSALAFSMTFETMSYFLSFRIIIYMYSIFSSSSYSNKTWVHDGPVKFRNALQSTTFMKARILLSVPGPILKLHPIVIHYYYFLSMYHTPSIYRSSRPYTFTVHLITYIWTVGSSYEPMDTETD